MFLCSRRDFRVGLSSTQTAPLFIFHCSLRMYVLAVREVSFYVLANSSSDKRPTRGQLQMRLSFMKNSNEIIDDLIETLKDGQEGFKQAAEGVRDPKLKSLFGEYSDQRRRFATVLQSEAGRQGETEPETTSSATGALHRGWINLKSAITGGNEHAILAECERGEDSAVKEYKKALDNGLSPSAQEVVSSQFAEIKAAHDRIKSLRDAAKG